MNLLCLQHYHLVQPFGNKTRTNIYISPLLILTKISLCGDFPSELSIDTKHNNKNVGIYFSKSHNQNWGLLQDKS